jgi:RNA polymerase sigma factor (sigma-70 family)
MIAVAFRARSKMSKDTTEPALLADYAATGSAETLNRIITAHAGLVHSACMRVLNDSHLADDAAQAVFLIFTQKARSLRADTVLPAWFYRTSVFVAKRIQRARSNRDRHEREAARMRENETVQAHERQQHWLGLQPHIDQALESLPAAERDAIVLRYFCGKTEGEAAKALACPVGTFSSRVTRALTKLRDKLRGRGMVLSLEMLGAAMSASAAPATSPAVVASIQAACIGNAGASLAATGIAQEALKAMFWIKVKSVAAACAVVCVLTAGVPVAMKLTAAEPDVAMQSPDKNGEPAGTDPLQRDIKQGESKIVLSPKVTAGPLYYERVTRTKFRSAKAEKNSMLDDYILNDFVDCQIYRLTIEAAPNDVKKFQFECVKTFALVPEEVTRDGKKVMQFRYLNQEKGLPEISFKSTWELINHSFTMNDSELKFIPWKNAFVGTGFMALNMGLSGPAMTSGEKARSPGDQWNIATISAKDPKVSTSRMLTLNNVSGAGANQMAQISAGPSKFALIDPEILKGQIMVMDQGIDASLGADLAGSISGVYGVRVHDCVVTSAKETISAKLKLTINVPDAVKMLAKQMIGESLEGDMTIEIFDRLIDQDQVEVLTGNGGSAEASSKCQEAWDQYFLSPDEYVKNLARFMQLEIKNSRARAATINGDF